MRSHVLESSQASRDQPGVWPSPLASISTLSQLPPYKEAGRRLKLVQAGRTELTTGTLPLSLCLPTSSLPVTPRPADFVFD